MAVYSIVLSFKFTVLFGSMLLGVPFIGFISNLAIGIFAQFLDRKEKLTIALMFGAIITAYGFIGFIQTMQFLKPITEVLGLLSDLRPLTEEEAAALLASPSLILAIIGASVLLFVESVFTEYVTLTWGGRLTRKLRKRFKSFKQLANFEKTVKK